MKIKFTNTFIFLFLFKLNIIKTMNVWFLLHTPKTKRCALQRLDFLRTSLTFNYLHFLKYII